MDTTKKLEIIQSKMRKIKETKRKKKRRVVKRIEKRIVLGDTRTTTPKKRVPIIYSKGKKSSRSAHIKTPDFIDTEKLLLDAEPLDYTKKDHYYLYKINEVIESDCGHIHAVIGTTKIHLCIYRINDSGNLP